VLVGQAVDRKVKEIEETRARLDVDLRELEGRLPGPIRSAKRIAGAAAGSTLIAGLLARRRRKRNDEKARRQEVVVRVVREDHDTP
jgi:hypothetical protein